MSSVFLPVGQCGNQIVKEFYKTVSHLQSQRPTFASEDGKWRCINIDSEAKVVNNFYQTNKRCLRESNVITGKHGRGTNWAMGYHGYGDRESEMMTQTIEALRREVELCDCYCGAVMVHSLSGGTGSGLGSSLYEKIRDEYPMTYILSVAVGPHASGESPLQHYNSLLSLTWMQKFSDGTLLFQNDEVLQRMIAIKNSKDVSFGKMNGYISDCLAGLLLPLGNNSQRKKENSVVILPGSEPWEILRSIFPMPAYKFAHTSCFKKRYPSWSTVASGLVNSLKRHDQHGNLFSSLACLAVIRGNASNTFPHTLQAVENQLKVAYNCVKWNPFPVDFWTGTENPNGPAADENSLTVCTNSSSFSQFAQNVLSKAKVMFGAKAYLHWYQRWGCDESLFLESFENMSNVIEDYSAASLQLYHS
ncbi:tubulin delta chain-like [Asterias rubens]|uniref:tubulin delta chain-like n=1 Tax=Asterias rubens TaxID=7604 RepID=UPI0014553D64|nr:tubulin delta chain-like [Asterias rubens]XP_033628518.1 tubulin delta chain-like [Asterias rubens]